MPKELIISANVHEKKVAMLEDGVVTEFYVERRDENQGVVGNLYKGRVMKVLPGMQSAFVDIGLERDAFLYVSDFTEFMEEEEEIDFREVTEAQHPPRIDDRSRRGDRPRPEPVPAGARPAAIAEPAREEETPLERPVRFEDAVEQLAEIADESVIPPPPPEEELPELEAAGGQTVPIEMFPVERVTDDEISLLEAVTEEAQTGAEAEAAEPEEKSKRGRGRKPSEPRKKLTKSEEKPAKATSRKAPAKPPATKRSRRRGEDEGITEPTESDSAAEFQRVTDEDIRQDAGELLKDAIVQEKIIEQLHTAEFQTGTFQPEPEPEWRVGSLRSLTDSSSGFQRVVDESAEAAAKEEASRLDQEITQQETNTVQPEETRGSPFRHLSDVVRGLYGRIQSGASGETVDAGEKAGFESSAEPVADESSPSYDVSSEGTESSGESSFEDDRDAEVRDRGRRGEFAVRRGGRGRRSRGGRREPPAAPPGVPGDEEGEATPAAHEEVAIKVEPPPHQEETAGAAAGRQHDARPPEARPPEARPPEAHGLG